MAISPELSGLINRYMQRGNFDYWGMQNLMRQGDGKLTPQQWQQLGGDPADYATAFGDAGNALARIEDVNKQVYSPLTQALQTPQQPAPQLPPPPPPPAAAPPPPSGLDGNAFSRAQRETEAAGQRGDWNNAQITPQQWAGMGGNPSEYPKLYAHTAFYNADGSLTAQGQSHNVSLQANTPPPPQQPQPQAQQPQTPPPQAAQAAGGLDGNAFSQAQRETEAAGQRGDWNKAQITPQQWVSMGGDLKEYPQLYGNTAFFKSDGSLTQAGQQHGVQSLGGVTRPRDPNTGAEIDTQTGTHISPTGGAVSPISTFQSPAETAATQDLWNRKNVFDQNLQNRINTAGPTGSSGWTQAPDGRWQQDVSFDPAQQKRWDQDQGLAQQAGQQQAGRLQQFGQQGNYDAASNVAGYNAPGQKLQEFQGKGNYSLTNVPGVMGQDQLLGERQRVEDSLYGSFSRRNEPQFKQEEEALRQSLADRGIPLNTERAKIEQQNLSQRHNDARLSAQSQATAMGGSEFDRTYSTSRDIRNMGVSDYERERYAPLTEGQAMEPLRQSGISDYERQRYAPMQESQMLNQFNMGYQMPTAAPVPNINVAQNPAAEIGMGYAGLDLQKYQSDLDAQTRLQLANQKPGGAGGGEPGGWDAQGAFDRYIFASGLTNNNYGVKKPSPGLGVAQTVSNIAGNAMTGMVNGIWGNNSSKPWGG